RVVRAELGDERAVPSRGAQDGRVDVGEVQLGPPEHLEFTGGGDRPPREIDEAPARASLYVRDAHVRAADYSPVERPRGRRGVPRLRVEQFARPAATLHRDVHVAIPGKAR